MQHLQFPINKLRLNENLTGLKWGIAPCTDYASISSVYWDVTCKDPFNIYGFHFHITVLLSNHFQVVLLPVYFHKLCPYCLAGYWRNSPNTMKRDSIIYASVTIHKFFQSWEQTIADQGTDHLKQIIRVRFGEGGIEKSFRQSSKNDSAGRWNTLYEKQVYIIS